MKVENKCAANGLRSKSTNLTVKVLPKRFLTKVESSKSRCTVTDRI